MPRNLNSTNSLNIMRPADSHIEGSTIAYTNGVCALPKPCKGALLDIGEADGILMVHLVGDDAGSYFRMSLINGMQSGAEFDQVIESGTTVADLSKLSLFPID